MCVIIEMVIKMIDGFMVYHMVQELNQQIKTGKIQKIYQINNNEILFKVRAHQHNYQLITSIDPQTLRVVLTNQSYPTPAQATNFTMILRKHLAGGIIEEITQVGFDRIIIVKVKKRNQLKETQTKYLIIELLGRHANIILCDEDYVIIQTQKPIGHAKQQRALQPKKPYPWIKQAKQNPLESFEPVSDYNQTYQGFSPAMNSSFQASKNPEQLFKDLLATQKFYADHKTLSLIKKTDQQQAFRSLEEAFDNLYNNPQHESIKQHLQEPLNEITRNIKKNERKLKKLEETYQSNSDYSADRYYGTLLFDNLYLFNPRDHLSELEVMDYDKQEKVKIKLDQKLTIKENAQAYLKKYHKQKTSLAHLQKQIALTKQNNDTLKLALEQLSFADATDASEIIAELRRLKLLKSVKTAKSTKTTKRPHYLTFRYNNVSIFVGKNNVQNDYVTFKLANKEATWLHVHQYAGSHVIINSREIDDDLLAVAGMLAIQYSSVPDKQASYQVDYTLVKNVKKIKGQLLGQVSLKEYQSITISYQDELFNKLIKES